MASKKGTSQGADDSKDFTWADQWDYNGSENSTPVGGQPSDGKPSNKKLVEYEKKMKAAASTGYVKAKAAASVGAQKVKAGTTTGMKWIKDQYQKRSQK